MNDQGLASRFSREGFPLRLRQAQAEALFARLGYDAKDFLRRFVDTQSTVELVPGTPALSSYTPYGQKGFLSKCVFGRDEAEAFAISLVHQGNRALAWSQAAILHANAENPLAPAIPLPEDFARINECAAQDTYAKQAWMASLAAEIDPVFDEKTKRDPVSAKEFKCWYKKSDLSEALVQAACASMKKPVIEGEAENFADHYHAEALRLYETQIDFLKDNGVPVRFMRIEDEDIRSIGDTFGPNILLEAQTRQPFKMNAGNTLHAGQLSQKYKIGNDVPTFTESLTRSGQDRASFLAKSKATRVQGPNTFARH